MLRIGDWLLPVKLKPNPRARRFILRLDTANRTIVITTPARADAEDALAFARSEAAWIRQRLKALPVPVPFIAGETIPLRGAPHLIHHATTGRGVVWSDTADDGRQAIHVTGGIEHLSRRLTDWLKRTARADITERVEFHAQTLGLSFRRITVRDQSSRWGSCTHDGVLSFSWRLILTPPEVLDYVAAHEVAHLKEMNHGPGFWRLVEQVVPDMKRHRRWLRRHGADLHRYGAAAD